MLSTARSELLSGLPDTLAAIVAPDGVFVDEHYPSEGLLQALAAERNALVVSTLSSFAMHGLVQTEEAAMRVAQTIYPGMSEAAQAMFVKLQRARQAAAARTIQRHIVTRTLLEGLPRELRSAQADCLARLSERTNGIAHTYLVNDMREPFVHNVALIVRPGASIGRPSVYVEAHTDEGVVTDSFIPAGDELAGSFVDMYEFAERAAMSAKPTHDALMHM